MAASFKEQLDDLLSKFSSGTIVGLDIGSHSLKVCELSGSPGKFKVEKFGVFNLPEAALIEDEVQKPSEMTDGILEVFKRAGIKSKLVCLGLFGPNTMTKRLPVPEGSYDEIEEHVLWEVEQYITFGADDSMIDFSLMEENEEGVRDALVAAAKMDVVDSYIQLLKEAKLSVKIVDLNVLALSNIFEEVYKKQIEDTNQGFLILDFGAQTTKILVYKRGGPIFTKEIPIGGGLITEEIQRQMGVSYEEAEDLKTTVDQKGNLPEEILNIINVQVDQQITEIKKNINFYITQGSSEKVTSCYVCGGSSLLPGLMDKLSAAIGIPVERMDVFSKIKIDDRKIAENPEQFAAIAPIVIGLGMRKTT